MDVEFHPLDHDIPPPQKGTLLDDHDMQRMGKIQELKVRRLFPLSLPSSPPPPKKGRARVRAQLQLVLPSDIPGSA